MIFSENFKEPACSTTFRIGDRVVAFDDITPKKMLSGIVVDVATLNKDTEYLVMLPKHDWQFWFQPQKMELLARKVPKR